MLFAQNSTFSLSSLVFLSLFALLPKRWWYDGIQWLCYDG